MGPQRQPNLTAVTTSKRQVFGEDGAFSRVANYSLFSTSVVSGLRPYRLKIKSINQPTNPTASVEFTASKTMNFENTIA